jgi:hypothetical protein
MESAQIQKIKIKDKKNYKTFYRGNYM